MDAFMKEFQHLKIQLKEIQSATDKFDENKVIGRGGFGNVYKGAISHKEQSIVAIKRLNPKHGQGNTEFWREITMLSRYTHENLISLVGFCDEGGEKILVYEHAYHGSLDRHLSSSVLTWTQRIKICLDVARGLSYLHDDKGTQQRVLHRDVKSSNILLDENWKAKVSDMGLSKIGPSNQQHTVIVTDVVGTVGYLDPMYMQTGILSKESDVYSFGVVLFEVLCGRLCYEKSNGQYKILVHRWKQSYNQNKLVDIIFKDILHQMYSESLKTFSDIAFQCLQDSRVDRPTMPDVVRKLESALEIQEWLAYYEDITRTAVPPLQYRSKAELGLLLSNGVLLNGGKTWFLLDDNGKHREMISIAECLITYASENVESQYSSDFNSRFASGTYSPTWDFRTRVRTQFLSPLTEYKVNLVFKCLRKAKSPKQQYIDIHYKFKENTKVSTVQLSDNREDEWLKAGLCEFTSDQSSIVDLEFIFAGHMYLEGVKVEGIEFEPIEKPNMLVDDVEKFVSPEPELVGYALVEVVEGSDMKPSSIYGRADPYIKGQLGSFQFRTRTRKKTLSPKWFEVFKIPITSWDSHNVLEIEVRIKNHFVDDSLGDCCITINDFRDGKRHEIWLSLQNTKMGRVRLAITVIKSV